MESVSGCQACFGTDAEAAWQQQYRLAHVANIVMTSHFAIMLHRCQACGQRFARVFCETVDWVGSNDPQESLAIPVTEAEANALVAAGKRGAEQAVEALSPPRRVLVSSFPADAKKASAYFEMGPRLLARHD